MLVCNLITILGLALTTLADEKSASVAPGPAPTPAPATTAASAPPSPAAERAEALREAASLLDKAGAALARGNRSYAEQLFSSAELIVGIDALKEIALVFREGAPPRITTPLLTLPKDSPKQPALAGASDEDEPPAKPKPGSLTGTLRIEGKGGISIGVVTLEPQNGRFRKPAPRRKVIEQRERDFAPHVLVVPVGSTVVFPNFDSVYHNVFSRSDAKMFDLGMYRNGQAREVTFDKEGVVSLGCNLHENMSANVVVVSSPYYSVTDAAGNFRFRSMEPGKYKLRAWQEGNSTPLVRDVEIKPGANTVSLSGTAASTAAKTDKFGVARGKTR